MSDRQALVTAIEAQLADVIQNVTISDMVTLEVAADQLLTVATHLRDQAPFCFEQLIDLCGVDYLAYGHDEWRVKEPNCGGYSRGVSVTDRPPVTAWDKPRFGVVYHLLSVSQNHRLRLKVYVSGEPLVPSVIGIWASANWYEREAFDLFGIYFEGHPDLRRLLTDYGFKGHPLRKDFPLIGEVEMRYDAAQQRCVYEPASIMPRVSTPKVIRQDNRYVDSESIDRESEQ